MGRARLEGDVVLTPVPGITVAGKYRIIRALGEGGMGAVFEAEHTLSLKRAAIKWVHPRLRERDRGEARLLQEARATARIRHRNVVQLYDVVVEDGAIFLVMELLEGELLSQHVVREPLHVWQLVKLLLPAMEGVIAAHEVGVIHRDIKPENIYLARTPAQRDPTPKVIDFGISKTFDHAGGSGTRSGIALGTPRYAAYEQLRNARDIDGRVDVYAFGVILYEALLGRAPYLASTFTEQAVHFVTTAPPPPRSVRPAVPEALDALVLRAIARDREQRLGSVAELVEGLRPFADPWSYPGALPVLRRGEHPLPEGGVAGDINTRPYSELDTPARESQADKGSEPAASGVPPPPRARKRALLGAALLVSLLVCLTAGALRLEPKSKISGTDVRSGPYGSKNNPHVKAKLEVEVASHERRRASSDFRLGAGAPEDGSVAVAREQTRAASVAHAAPDAPPSRPRRARAGRRPPSSLAERSFRDSTAPLAGGAAPRVDTAPPRVDRADSRVDTALRVGDTGAPVVETTAPRAHAKQASSSAQSPTSASRRARAGRVRRDEF